jgi:WD40 repeat protein
MGQPRTDGLVRLYTTTPLSPLHAPLAAVDGYVDSMDFSPDGSLLAISGTDGTTRLVDVASWRQLGSPLPGSENRATYSSFADHGQEVITYSDTGEGTIWPMTITAWLQHACGIANRRLTQCLNGQSFSATAHTSPPAKTTPKASAAAPVISVQRSDLENRQWLSRSLVGSNPTPAASDASEPYG